MRKIPFYALLIANIISKIGNVLTMLAIPWFVLQTTGSVLKTGIVAASSTLPWLITAFFGGTVVDRLGYKRASIFADLASGMAIMLIPLFYNTVGLPFWHLLVLVFLSSLCNTPGVTARRALLPDLATMAGLGLERANSIYQIINNLSAFVGPPLAGILIATIGTNNVMWIDAITFFISALIISIWVVQTESHQPVRTPGRYLDELKQGLQFVINNHAMRAIVTVITFTALLDAPIFMVVLPVYANKILNSATDLGLIVGAFGGSAVLGALFFGMLGHKLPRRIVLLTSLMLSTIPLWIIAQLPTLSVVIGAMIVVGLAAGPFNPLLMTILQEQTPAEMRGRIFAMIIALSQVVAPLGAAIAGYLLSQFGISNTLYVIVACYCLVVLGIAFGPTFYQKNEVSLRAKL